MTCRSRRRVEGKSFLKVQEPSRPNDIAYRSKHRIYLPCFSGLLNLRLAKAMTYLVAFLNLSVVLRGPDAEPCVVGHHLGRLLLLRVFLSQFALFPLRDFHRPRPNVGGAMISIMKVHPLHRSNRCLLKPIGNLVYSFHILGLIGQRGALHLIFLTILKGRQKRGVFSQFLPHGCFQ